MDLQTGISLGLACFLLIFLFFVYPRNKWHFVLMHELCLTHKIAIVVALFTTICISVMPMSLSPYWNGTLQYLSDKQQYDRMADALLQGHLYIDNSDVDPALQSMENPYDNAERERLGVNFNWDEAYYQGHYYMYFGIVPTVLLFIPFKLLTGTALLTYQATQTFATLSIIGLFYLFYIFWRSFFPKFPFSLYLILASAFSILSIGYSISAPALYCTAIVSGICLMVWSIICFFKAVLLQADSPKRNVYLLLGAILGALAFGCRPPVAIANLIVFVLIYKALQNDTYKNKVTIRTIALFIVPYIVVGVVLMAYNYARFGNVFEFGQSYQLTLADQHNYMSFLDRFDLRQILTGFWLNLYAPCGLSDTFPFLRYNGFFLNYPILLLTGKIFSKPVVALLKERRLYSFSMVTFLTSFFIILLDVYWSPFLSKRYHLDFLYLLCIVTFLVIAAWLEVVQNKKRKLLLFCITLLAFYVFVAEFLFFCIPFDGNYVMCYPEKLNEIYNGLHFGL